MATCNGCVHCDVCDRLYELNGIPKIGTTYCGCFKDKSLLAPCEVGTVVYLIDPEELKADPQNCSIYEDEVYEVGRGIASDGSVKWLCLVKDTGLDFYDTNIGATAFFDYEAAQMRLKKEVKE